MPEMTRLPPETAPSLQERANRLAIEKAYLELVIRLMNKISAVPGLDHTVENIVRNVTDVIGGTNVILYYLVDNDIYYADVYGERKGLAEVADPQVGQVMKTRQFIEFEHEFGDTQMLTPEFSKAYTWVVPLLAGAELVGVFKIENLNIAMRDFYQQLPTFFTYAALVLRNELLGHSRLKQAHDRLAQEMAVRLQAEERLQQANEALEIRVAERTAELRNANEQLRASEKQIQSLLDRSEQSRRALLSILEDERRVEAALRESEHKLEEATRIAHVGYWERDYAAKRITLSEEARQIFGLPVRYRSPTLSEWHEQWLALIHPEDQPKVTQILADALAGGPPYNADYRVIRPNGDVRYIHSFAELTRDDAGQPLRLFGTMVDVTERKQAEKALRESEERYRMLFNIMDEGVAINELVRDEQGEVIDYTLLEVNPAFTKNSTFTREQVLGRRATELYHMSQEYIREWWRKHSEMQQVVHTEMHYAPSNRWFHITTTPLEGNRFATFSVDITERKRAEAERQAHLYFFESMDKVNRAIQGTTDLEHMLSDVLDVVLAILHCDRASLIYPCDPQTPAWWVPMERTRPEYPGAMVFGHDIPSDAESQQVFSALLSTEAPVPFGPQAAYPLPEVAKRFGTQSQLAMALHPKVEKPWMFVLHQCSYARVWTAEEAQLFREVGRRLADALTSLLAYRDLRESREEIRQLNQELEQRVANRTAQLEAANKELEAFAYSVSHDLRAPLRHIDGFVDLLHKRAQPALDPQSQHYLAVIADSAKQMGTLIDDLLSFSRMGRNEMFITPVGLGGLIQEVIREFAPEAEGRAIAWHIGDLPAVTGDRAMLRIALVNLVSNALKFTRHCPAPRIEIGCRLETPAQTVLFIRDNGVGFDMQYADKLFGVFQRLHRQEEFEGTGIGLANVRRIIERHGGRTWAEGEVGQGATFYFSLPTQTQEAV